MWLILAILLLLIILIYLPSPEHFTDYNNFKYSDHMTVKDIQTLQQGQDIMTGMLRELDRICRKYKLKYWCVGGTLIGVMRHQGWVPWDGDIDIGMEENDYQQFRKVVDQELSPDMWFAHKPKGKPCSKIRSRKAHYIYTTWGSNWDVNQGIHLDIFLFKRDKDMLISDFKGNEVKDTPYDIIFPLKQALFDNMKVYIPNNTKQYLINGWGNYPPKLPPKDKRFPHEGRIECDPPFLKFKEKNK